MATARVATERPEHRRRDVLVEPEWLQSRLGDPAVCVIEVDVRPVAYDEGHIAGAHLWNVYGDLKNDDYRTVGRASIERLVRRAGITADSTVVFYGYAPAMGFWLMKRHRHADVRILDCAREVWRDGGRPWTSDVTASIRSSYRLPTPDDCVRADTRQVLDAIDDPRCTCLLYTSPSPRD